MGSVKVYISRLSEVFSLNIGRSNNIAKLAAEERSFGQVQITCRCFGRYICLRFHTFMADHGSLGHLGTFTLSLHWMNLGNQPVEVLIEDVYLLVVPSPQTNVDPKEEEDRMQDAKAERLENAELLHMKGAQVGEMPAGAQRVFVQDIAWLIRL